MFEKGSLVVYGINGVYRVEDIGAPPDSPISHKERLYYRMTPVFGKGTTYIPVDTKVFIRSVMTKEEAKRLISRMPEVEESVCPSRIQRVLAEQYQAALDSHKTEELVRLLKTVYKKNLQLAQAGKRLCTTDEQYRKKAESLLYGELSIALGIPYDKVEDYIARELGEQNGMEMD